MKASSTSGNSEVQSQHCDIYVPPSSRQHTATELVWLEPRMPATIFCFGHLFPACGTILKAMQPTTPHRRWQVSLGWALDRRICPLLWMLPGLWLWNKSPPHAPTTRKKVTICALPVKMDWDPSGIRSQNKHFLLQVISLRYLVTAMQRYATQKQSFF